MDRSFWIHLLNKHLKPETLHEKVLIITHSLLLDLGFVPVRSIKDEDSETEDALSHTNISKEFEIPINLRNDGVSMELLPSNWKSNGGKCRLFYISKICSEQIDKVIPELFVEFTSSELSIFTLMRINFVEETMKLEFPFQILERHSTNESLIFELSSWIRDEINRFFSNNKIHTNSNPKTDTKERHKVFGIKCEPSLKTSQRNFQEYIGSNYSKSVDPLIDNNGVRGSLVGPESIIFKNRPKTFGIPKNIPISSIPGGTTTPDNDMFFPPGNNSNYTFNFRD
ncbi:uncharacterized protein ELE39_000654 [Cryptosporidium sp. chipmunk genotype I]|uniref:uncharacterized protein n=1 Tax=Cryptosporidium sp. chipmunk genotype I TaxID=1280935 RepID=UPI00351A778F|nr:hypothetical protein ELE39_000654 [Cryptosporidium sp. chipmunk genotype I]